MYDETVDYSSIDVSKGKYNQAQLEKALAKEERAELIFSKFQQMAGRRVLGFCSGIKHAEFMAEFFHGKGIAAGVVHSQNSKSARMMNRQHALNDLANGRLRVLFCVDLFNEGIDVPQIDTVLFLRPTDSYNIFLQQLGRGLRKFDGKEALIVLDFIGNYRRAHHLPLLLAGENPLTETTMAACAIPRMKLPEGCIANFDFRLIDLFERLRQQDPLPKRIKEEFLRLYETLGRVPKRVDVFNGIDIPFRAFRDYDEKRGWLKILSDLGLADEIEVSWCGTPAEMFLKCLESTAMSKSYKIPTISCFLKGTTWRTKVGFDEIAESWSAFYNHPHHEQDLLRDSATSSWRAWPADRLARHAWRNPVKFLSQSEPEFFGCDSDTRTFYLQPALTPYLTAHLAEHVRDILTLRTLQYYSRLVRGKSEEA